MDVIAAACSRGARKRLALPSEVDVRAFELRLGIELPADYRRFLLEFNGGCFTEPEIQTDDPESAGSALDVMLGLETKCEYSDLVAPSLLGLFEDNDPPQILVIGNSPLNDLFLLVTGEGENHGNILLKKPFEQRGYFLAEGIEEFVGLLIDPTWDLSGDQ